jgi:hypothetical protein
MRQWITQQSPDYNGEYPASKTVKISIIKEYRWVQQPGLYLANIYSCSCSFIVTDDTGKLNVDGSFEVLGRMDGSDLRGCRLMVV